MGRMEGSAVDSKANAAAMFAKAQMMAKARLGKAPEAVVLGDPTMGRGAVPKPGDFVKPQIGKVKKDKKDKDKLSGPPAPAAGPAPLPMTVSSRPAAPIAKAVTAVSEADKKKDKKKDKK